MMYLFLRAGNSTGCGGFPSKLLAALALPLALLLAVVSPAASAEADTGEGREISFEEGHTGATVEGTVKGRDHLNYTVRAKSGQRLTVEMQTDNAASYFNIFAPGKDPGDTAMFIGSVKGNRFSGVLPESGIYTIQVYLMRSAARRDETANFSLEMSVTGATPAASAGERPSWPDAYDASGNLPCSAGEPAFNRACPFRVSRQPPDATIWTTSPAAPSTLRILYFRQGRFSSDAPAKVKWQRQGDNWRIAIGDRESFLVPDAVLQGD